MDFSSEKRATFDEKGRVVLPADFKNQLGGKIPDGQMAVEIDPYEKCLNIYPMPEWKKRLSDIKSKLNRDDRIQSRLLDMFYRNFKVVPVPDSCRINIPNDFLNKVGIKKDVVFVGVGERIRLWDSAQYEAYIDSQGDFGTLFEQEICKRGE
jgi:MraZ protein